MKKILAFLLVVVVMIGLVGCGKSSKEVLAGSYANGSSSDFSYGGNVLGKNYKAYALNLYTNGTYEMTVTEITDMGGTVAGTTSMTNYGTYKKGSAADGFVDVTIDAPTRIIYNSYSTLGGYAFDYDTNTDKEFIIPGGDDVAMNKDEFLSALGYSEAITVYIALDSTNAETCRIEFTQE